MTLRTTQDLPTRADQPPPGMGHNQPPSETEIARSKMEEHLADRIKKANEWVESFRDPESGELKPITDEATASACADAIDQLRDEYRAVEAARVAERKPLNDQLDSIQGYYRPLLDKIETAAEFLKGLKKTWLDLLDKRQRDAAAAARKKALADAEEAERLRVAALQTRTNAVEATVKANEAAARAEQSYSDAAAATAAKPQVRGETTGRASGYRTTWRAEIVDAKLALVHYATHGKILAALQVAADADARALHERADIPGIKVISEKVV